MLYSNKNKINCLTIEFLLKLSKISITTLVKQFNYHAQWKNNYCVNKIKNAAIFNFLFFNKINHQINKTNQKLTSMIKKQNSNFIYLKC